MSLNHTLSGPPEGCSLGMPLAASRKASRIQMVVIALPTGSVAAGTAA